MAITKGTRVAGHINSSGRRVNFTGIVTDTFTTVNRGEVISGVIVQCQDGNQRTARTENVQAITINMTHTLAVIDAEGGAVGYGLRSFAELGINAHSVNALIRRGLLATRQAEDGMYVDIVTG